MYCLMKNVLFVLILVVTPFHGFCQADESPQKSGSFYIETFDITGALSEMSLNPMVGYAVSDNFVLGLGFNNIIGAVVDGYGYLREQQNLGVNLGGRYFTQSNLFFGGSAGISGSASGSGYGLSPGSTSDAPPDDSRLDIPLICSVLRFCSNALAVMSKRFWQFFSSARCSLFWNESLMMYSVAMAFTLLSRSSVDSGSLFDCPPPIYARLRDYINRPVAAQNIPKLS